MPALILPLATSLGFFAGAWWASLPRDRYDAHCDALREEKHRVTQDKADDLHHGMENVA